jgi:hypothetical protein
MIRPLLRPFLIAVVLSCIADAAAAQCTAPHKIEWPAANPVWTLCWTPPDASSGIDGSGLEVTHVFYKGRRVFWRLNMPVLNVIYDQQTAGNCGPTYRDWLTDLQEFDANNVLQPGYAEPTTPPKTVCDAPGADVGSFAGVAVEKLADRLVLTSQTAAGWYRYINKTTFYPDGRITPEFGFTAVEYPCIHRAHTHHGYWRMDIDVEGAANDSIRERKQFLFFKWWSTLGSEQTRLRASSNSRRWRVRDGQTGRAVEIQPGAHDSPGGDAFGGPDIWALLYHPNEADDGGSPGGPNGDAQHITAYVNGESIAGQDVVLWYRISHRHEGGATCMLVGPTLRVVGNW